MASRHVPRRCWLTPGVQPRPSAIHGTGLFATVPLAAGAAVSRLGGRVVSTAELHELVAQSDEHVDTIGLAPEEHLALAPGSLNRFANHSCDPNLWWFGPFDLIARRDIAAGEELTHDYAASTVDEAFELACTCGAAGCRAVVRGSDGWRLSLVRRYAGHVSPAVAAEAARRQG